MIKSRAKLELKLPRTVPDREMFDGSEMVKRSDEAELERPGSDTPRCTGWVNRTE